MHWLIADLKKEDAICNARDQLGKFTDNHQLSLHQMSLGFKSREKLDGVHEKTTLVAQFRKTSWLYAARPSNWKWGNLISIIPISEDMYINHITILRIWTLKAHSSFSANTPKTHSRPLQISKYCTAKLWAKAAWFFIWKIIIKKNHHKKNPQQTL